MTEIVQPEWLQGYQPDASPPKGNPQWQKGMKSPNPAGRPKGIVDRRTKMTQAILEDVTAILRVVKENALNGDTAAAALLLSKVMPSLRSQAERVEFDYDATAPISKQVESVLDAVAKGLVAPDVAKSIVETIGTLSQIRATEDLEARIAALEERQ